MPVYLLHLLFIWHPGCHSYLGTMPTIPPHPSVRCNGSLRSAQVWSTLCVQYDTCNTHLRRKSISVGQPFHSVSFSIQPYSSFPASSSFLHRLRIQLSSFSSPLPFFMALLPFILVILANISSLFSLRRVASTKALHNLLRATLRCNYCTSRERFPSCVPFRFALLVNLRFLNIIICASV